MKNLSQEEMKKIISDVVSDYKKNNDIDISIRLVTKKEFYQEFLRMKKYKYYKVLDYLKLPFTSAAITEELSKNIYIFFRVLTKFNTLFFFSKVLYNYFVRLLIISTILSLQALLFYRKNDIIILLR